MKALTKESLVIAMAAASLLALGCGAEAGSDASGPTDAQRQAFEKEVVALKGARAADYDARVAELQVKYGIRPGETFDTHRPKATPQVRPSSEEGLGETRQALSSGTAMWTQSYDVQATYYETLSLEAGQELNWWTTAIDANVDPVMVLFQYDQTESDCSVSASAVPKLSIKTFNDDYGNSTQSRIHYTVPTTGCYAVVIYAYSPQQAGMVGLNKDGCTAPKGGVCSGSNPVVCTQPQPAICMQTTGGYGSAVAATGTAVRGAPDLDFMTAVNSSEYSDPRLFVFNYSNSTGAENDDISGSNRDSAIDRSDFKFINNYPNAVLLTGYSSGGTATFVGYRR
jgi:hypothetical protein